MTKKTSRDFRVNFAVNYSLFFPREFLSTLPSILLQWVCTIAQGIYKRPKQAIYAESNVKLDVKKFEDCSLVL